MSAIHLDNSRQQREERCTHVRDALINDQNVYRLNKHNDETVYYFSLRETTCSFLSIKNIHNASHYVLSFVIEEKMN